MHVFKIPNETFLSYTPKLNCPQKLVLFNADMKIIAEYYILTATTIFLKCLH